MRTSLLIIVNFFFNLQINAELFRLKHPDPFGSYPFSFFHICQLQASYIYEDIFQIKFALHEQPSHHSSSFPLISGKEVFAFRSRRTFTVFSQRAYFPSGIRVIGHKISGGPAKKFLFKSILWCWCHSCPVCCFPTQGGMPPCQAVCCFPTQGLKYCGALHHFRSDDTYARWEIGRLGSNREVRPGRRP